MSKDNAKRKTETQDAAAHEHEHKPTEGAHTTAQVVTLAHAQAQAQVQTQAEATPRFARFEIDEFAVMLPFRFSAGPTVLTENQAALLDSVIMRAFCNNQQSNAKGRAKRYSEAKNDAEREANVRLTGTEYERLYEGYEPNVLGQRSGGTERLQAEVAFKFWTNLVNAHNEAVARGQAPLIAKAGVKQVTIATPPRKGRNQSEESAKAAREAFDTDRAMFLARLIEHAVYGPQIAALVQAELESRQSNVLKTDSTDVVVSDGDLI